MPLPKGQYTDSSVLANVARMKAPTRITDGARVHSHPLVQGLTLVHFQLNVSAFCGIGGASRDRLGAVQGLLKGCWGVLGGVQGVFVFQKRLKLS
jgi:hypothetical protein